MSFDAWFTLAVVLAMLIVLTRDVLPPAAVVLAATTTLLVSGVIDEEQAFSGFSNSAPLTVAALYVLARGVEKTGVLGPMVSRLLGNPRLGRARRTRAPVAADRRCIRLPQQHAAGRVADSGGDRLGQPRTGSHPRACCCRSPTRRSSAAR